MKFLLIFLAAPLLTFGATQTPYVPWLTGPFLAPTPTNSLPGHPYVQPSLIFSNTYGNYQTHQHIDKTANLWGTNVSVDYGMGFTQRLGIELILNFTTNFLKGKTATYLNDTILYLGYQLANDDRNSWVPNIRLMIQETFPTGNYQKFHSSALDNTGQGAFQTGPVIAIQKLFPLHNHFFSLQLTAGYLFSTKIHVKGLNNYGGGRHTSGTVRPGQIVVAFFSGEYSINQHLVFAFDSYFTYQRSSPFSGKTQAPTGLPTSYQLSIAPAIEYNFTARSGLITGIWATIAGKNEEAFASYFLSYVYQF